MLLRVTLASGTTAPVESVTVPSMPLRNCAKEGNESRSPRTSRTANCAERRNFMMIPPEREIGKSKPSGYAPCNRLHLSPKKTAHSGPRHSLLGLYSYTQRLAPRNAIAYNWMRIYHAAPAVVKQIHSIYFLHRTYWNRAPE